MFKIISNKFTVKLLTANDAQTVRWNAARAAEGEQASGSEDESDARTTSTSKASIDSQCARIRVATAYAVSDREDFYALANSCEYRRGTFMSDTKADKAVKTSLTHGLTLGELKDEIVKQAEEIDSLKRVNEWADEKIKDLEKNCTCKRAKPTPTESKEEEEEDVRLNDENWGVV